MKKSEKNLHWSEEKEVIKTNKPVKFLFKLFQIFPSPVVLFLIYPIAFFYYIFSKRARTECKIYQKNLKTFAKEKLSKRISVYRQILSFTLCVLEKIEGWLGKFVYKDLILHDDDLKNLQALISSGKGAVIISSHLGNIELMRSLYNFGENGLQKSVKISVIMEMKATEQFTKTLQEINPDFSLNVVTPGEISPETIIDFQERIENGEMIIFTGDRTSAASKNRVIRNDFLGKPADFPYGVFLLAALLDAPVFYMFGLREKISVFPRYNIYVEKSKISFDCKRSEREERIKALCFEFVKKLEKFCVEYPEQWYNFYNFWLTATENSIEE